MRKMKIGFTLAEVLITLGIIGVVAAITIPNMINNSKAAKLRSQFLKAHSSVQQAYRLMLADDISIDPKDYSTHGTFYKMYMNYFQGVTDCGAKDTSIAQKNRPCYKNSDTPYKTFTGSNVASTWFDDGQLALQDGTLVLIENYQNRLWVSVDINGYNNKPNIWGYDLFTFEVLEGGLTAMGSDGTSYSDMDNYCNTFSTNTMNGVACTKKAINDSEYFKELVKKIK